MIISCRTSLSGIKRLRDQGAAYRRAPPGSRGDQLRGGSVAHGAVGWRSPGGATKYSSKTLAWTEAGTPAAAVILGWAVFADQLHQDGWTSGGGTLWLLILAVTATAGALIAIVARRADRHWRTAFGLAAAAASPVVFAYVPSLVLIVLAIVEVHLALIHAHRTPSPAN
jgi:hypothetical protein